MARWARPISLWLFLALMLAACGGRGGDGDPAPRVHPCMDEQYLVLLQRRQQREEMREEEQRIFTRLDTACRTASLQLASSAGDSTDVAERKENYRWLFGMALGAGVLYLITGQY